MHVNYEKALHTIFSRRRISGDVIHDKFIRQRVLKDALNRLGNPEKLVRCVHVTGTNGKGTVSTKIASILSNCTSSDIGLFTSPHVLSFRERIRVNDTFISPSEVSLYHEQISSVFDKESPPLFFEECFLMAMLHFREKQVEWAILEAGMGGLLDSTNVITPEVSVVTSVGWDHMAILGDTLEKIAEEKSGIAKSYVPLVIGPQAAQFPIFKQKAEELHSPFIELKTDWLPHNMSVNDLSNNELNTLLAATSVDALHVPPIVSSDLLTALKVQMPFRFQLLPPAALERAVNVATEYFRRFNVKEINGENVSTKSKKNENSSFQDFVSSSSWGVILDAGHNKSALERLTSDIHLAKESLGISNVIICCTLSAERQVDVLTPLLSISDCELNLVVGKHPRLKSASAIEEELKSLPQLQSSLRLHETHVSDVIRRCVLEAKEKKALLVLTGSFFLMPEALSALGLLPVWAENATGSNWFSGVSEKDSPSLVHLEKMPVNFDEEDILGLRRGWWLGSIGSSSRANALADGIIKSLKSKSGSELSSGVTGGDLHKIHQNAADRELIESHLSNSGVENGDKI